MPDANTAPFADSGQLPDCLPDPAMDFPAGCEQRELQRLQVLHDYHVLDTPPEAFFDDMVYIAALACATPTALITLIDTDRQWFKARIGLQETETSRDIAVCNYALEQSDRVMVIEDIEHDPRFVDNPLVNAAPYMRFYAGAPLVTPEGHVLGTLCVIDKVPRKISGTQRDILKVLARSVVAALALRRDVAQLEQLSTTDGVTGLGNRRAFEDRLDSEVWRARRYGAPLSLMLIDVDGFRRFNDLHGHPAGERLLQSLAGLLHRNLRDGDHGSCLGADEFAVILPDTSSHVACRVGEALRQSIAGDHAGTTAVSLSIGVAEIDSMVRDSQALVTAADAALLEARHAGGNCVVGVPASARP
jgi:diguanylate cyclase (GGDEF)-like protein